MATVRHLDVNFNRLSLTLALYSNVRQTGDPTFNELPEAEQQDWIADARACERRCDPIARAVAIEKAAEMLATVQGWTWPDLNGFQSVLTDHELAKAEARQKIRFWAREMCHAYERHLKHGGKDGQPQLEDAILADVTTQRMADAELKAERQPLPPFVERLAQQTSASAEAVARAGLEVLRGGKVESL